MTSTTTTLQTLQAGDTIKFGQTWTGSEYVDAFATVVAATAEKITVTNPDAGALRGNRNRGPRTMTFKRTSARLAALSQLPVS